MNLKESIKLKGHWTLEKFDKEGKLFGKSEFDNVFLNSGINEIWKLVCGNSGTTFTNALATIGVGDSVTAEDPTQTDLQAVTNKTYKGMDTSYPTSGTLQKAVFKSSFGSTDANYAWQEFVVKNSSSLICLDRKVSNQGTKVSGQTWVLTAELSLA